MKTVILAAGFGSRLWPLSTSEKPKQFQPLINGQSLLGYTYSMLSKIIPEEDLYILTLKELERHVHNELLNIDTGHIITVPERRNTLPHTLWALKVLGGDPEEPILFKSVDHYVVNPEEFLASLGEYFARYKEGSVRPFTLLCNFVDKFDKNDGYALVNSVQNIKRFVEKPSEREFNDLRQQGVVYRSPFIYVSSKAACAKVLEQLSAPIARQATRLLEAPPEQWRQTFLEMPFADISTTLFQAAVDLKVEVISYRYIDVGRFATLYELNAKDTDGNVVIGNSILGKECADNFILNQTTKPLVVANLRGTVVVQTSAGSFVAPMQEADVVGEIYKTKIYGH